MSQNHLSQHWFFLRGLGRDASHWGDFPKKFQAALPRAVVHCIDLPGTGTRAGETSPWRLKQVAAGVHDKYRQILLEEKIPESAPRFVFGISLGAMVTLHWIAQHAEEFRGAVLINPSMRGISPWYHRLSPVGYRKLVEALLARDPVTREKHVLDLTSQNRSWTEQEVRARVQHSQNVPAMTYGNFFRQLLAAATDAPPTKKPRIPVLLLNSLGDEMVHPDCSMAIQKKWQLEMKRHAWAGHDLPLDDAQWTIEAVRAWCLENRFELAPLQKVANPLTEE